MLGLLLIAAVGWLLALLSGVILVRANEGRLIGRQARRLAGNLPPRPRNWPSIVAWALGMLPAGYAGSELQLRALGGWAVAVAFAPMVIAFVIPVVVHDRRLVGSQPS